jgi:SsrA-binding protein
MPTKNLAENKAAGFGYTIRETLTAGLKLAGPEVKAAKLGHLSLRGSFVTIRTAGGKAEAWVRAMHISPYLPASGVQRGYEPARDRKLLLRAEEIRRLIGTIAAKGLTVIPLRVYVDHSLVKMDIGVAAARTKADKRDVLKKRDAERQIRKHVT